MKKRILAIFLCLILTVSLAAAVAAKNDVIQPGGTYIIVPDNPSQPEPDYTPVRNDTTMTLQIPIGKVVTLGGNTAPQRTTFTFNATPSNPEYGHSSNTGLWDVRNCTVSVNGEGTFNCVMTIRIEKEDFHFLTDKEGIIITETDDEQPGWTYDETRWFLQPHYEWNENIHEYEWTGSWDCYNDFKVTEGGVLFDEKIGVIGLLGLAQALDAHVVLAVEELYLGILLRDHAGEFPVDHGVGAVHVREGLFKADVIIVSVHAAAHGERDDPLAVGQQQPVHLQLVKMVERALQRGLFQLQLVELLRVHRGLVRLVPDAEHLVALRQIVVRDGSGEPVGEFILKAVAVVALGLQLRQRGRYTRCHPRFS